MRVVAIHQPNYLPWLGYFAKISEADEFVFLDDVQYSKNSYTNRVKVLHADKPRWLTVPVSFRYGDTIDNVMPAQDDWVRRHIDGLKGFYQKSPFFGEIWTDITDIYCELPCDSLASINIELIERLSTLLKLSCTFKRSSSMVLGNLVGDKRLAEIVSILAPGGKYLSGEGGNNYQDKATFSSAGISLAYRAFVNPVYTQSSDQFVSGLSVIDAAFHLGWTATAKMLSHNRT